MFGLHVGETFSMIVLFLIVIPFGWIFYSIGSIVDTIYVRTEISFGCCVLLITDVIDIILILSAEAEHEILVFDYILPCIAFCLIILSSTLYVLAKGTKSGEVITRPSYMATLRGNVVGSPKTPSEIVAQASLSPQEDLSASTDVISIISTKEGFHIFCEFLVQEYSTENLLFVVEVSQFKRNAVSKMCVYVFFYYYYLFIFICLFEMCV